MVFLSQEQKVDGKGRLGIAGFTVVDSCRQKNKTLKINRQNRGLNYIALIMVNAR